MLSLFKQKTSAPEQPLVGPAASARIAHVRKMAGFESQRRAWGEKQAALTGPINAAAKSMQDIEQLERDIEAKRVVCVADGLAPPDLTADLARLDHLHARHPVLEQSAAVAMKARAELAARSEAVLRNEYAPMQPALNRLLVDDREEHMVSLADRLDAALETFYNDVWRPMWLDACAIDQVSTANHLGVFTDSLRFTWFIPQLPRHPVFDAITKKWYEKINAEWPKLTQDAQALVGRLLRNDDENEPQAS